MAAQLMTCYIILIQFVSVYLLSILIWLVAFCRKEHLLFLRALKAHNMLQAHETGPDGGAFFSRCAAMAKTGDEEIRRLGLDSAGLEGAYSGSPETYTIECASLDPSAQSHAGCRCGPDTPLLSNDRLGQHWLCQDCRSPVETDRCNRCGQHNREGTVHPRAELCQQKAQDSLGLP